MNKSKLDIMCERLGIRISCEYGANKAPPPDGFEKRACRPWRVTLRKGRRRLSVDFFQGMAHESEPTAADVVSCLVSDVWSIDNARTFSEWCSELGYDTDSRKAETIYNKISLLAPRVRRFLGDDFDAVSTAASEY